MKMKTPLLTFAFLALNQVSWAQLKATPVCPAFTVDVLDGNVNKLYPESSTFDIKSRLPCFSDVIEENPVPASGCSGVFFKDKGINFYTYRDYIEITESFKGNLSVPLLGAERSQLFKWFGLPKQKDIGWEVYQVRHGTLIVYYDDSGKVNKLQISSKSAETLRLCE
jgi:hypothetical protein